MNTPAEAYSAVVERWQRELGATPDWLRRGLSIGGLSSTMGRLLQSLNEHRALPAEESAGELVAEGVAALWSASVEWGIAATAVLPASLDQAWHAEQPADALPNVAQDRQRLEEATTRAFLAIRVVEYLAEMGRGEIEWRSGAEVEREFGTVLAAWISAARLWRIPLGAMMAQYWPRRAALD